MTVHVDVNKAGSVQDYMLLFVIADILQASREVCANSPDIGMEALEGGAHRRVVAVTPDPQQALLVAHPHMSLLIVVHDAHGRLLASICQL